MRLLIVVDTFVPARTSGAVQMRDLVRELGEQGHRPTVLVPMPGLPEPCRLEEVDGIEVLRVRTPRLKDVGKIRRALGEWLLPHSLLRGLRRSPLASIRWDGVVWYSPTIFLGPVVAAIKRRSGCRGYLILRDLFPDWAVDAGLLSEGPVYRYFKRVERRQYALADVIGIATPANLPRVRADCPAGATIEVLPNWLAAPEVTEPGIDLAAGPLAGRTIFAYAGNMGAAQGMDCLLDLARRLRHRSDAGFLFIGRGSELPRLRQTAVEQALDNVQFIDEIASERVPGVLAQCHVGLIALHPNHTTHNIPGKLLTYLHAGLPVLARINAGNDLEALIRDEEIGHVVTGEGDAEELSRHAIALLDSAARRSEMGTAGRDLAQRMFSPAPIAEQIVEGLAPRRADLVSTPQVASRSAVPR